MNEKDPVARLNLPNGETFEARRDTASLYTFMGKLAIYNHVYCYDVRDNEVQQSFYIFNFVDGYRELAEYMQENDYTQHLNLTEISRSDTEAYERAALHDLHTSDTFPEEWLE